MKRGLQLNAFQGWRTADLFLNLVEEFWCAGSDDDQMDIVVSGLYLLPRVEEEIRFPCREDDSLP